MKSRPNEKTHTPTRDAGPATANDGDPAFPLCDAGNDVSNPGMSLRDWFAGQALPWALTQLGCETPLGFCNDPIALSYEIADAMIAARSGGAA